MREVRVYLPANLDLDLHLQKFPPKDIEQFNRDRLVYLLSLLISIPAGNKKLIKKTGIWVPLYSVLLAKMIGKKYSSYVEYALGNTYPQDADAKIIVTNNDYKPDGWSKGYTFVDKYRSTGHVKEELLTENVLLRKLRRIRHDRLMFLSSLYPSLVKWFDPSRLKIDAAAARMYAEKLVDWEKQKSYDFINRWFNSTSVASGRKEFKEYQSLPDHDLQLVSYLTNISRIEEGDYSLSVDDNVRRFHSNITNLKSQLRYFLTFDGRQLVSIDIVNCQPFLSTSLFRQELFASPTSWLNERRAGASELVPGALWEEEEESDPEEPLASAEVAGDYFLEDDDTQQKKRRSTESLHIRNIAPAIYDDLHKTTIKLKSSPDYLPPSLTGSERSRNRGRTTIIPLITSLIMFSENLVNYNDDGNNTKYPDVERFIRSVTEGKFYEDFLDLLSSKGITGIVTRPEAKKAIYLVLFTDNRFFNGEEAGPKKLFSEVYPTVYSYFSLLKHKDKSRLSRLLQSIESWLVLDRICERISDERPDLPIFTVHDSIVTTEGNQDYVQRIMKEEIQHYVGHVPVLKTIIYNPSDLPGTYEDYLNS